MPGGAAREQQHAKSRGDDKAKAAKKRARRGGIVPGERAWNRPKDPNAVEPFAIKVENDEIFLELVAHAHGGGKRAYRLAVKRVELGGPTQGWEAGREKGIELQMRGGEGVRGRSGRELSGRKEGAWELSSGGDDEAERKMPMAGSGRGRSGGGCGERNFSCNGGSEAEGKTPRNGVVISVGFVGEGHLDGVHGAPVFLGGQLFGFALQVCMFGERKNKTNVDDTGGKA